MNWCELKSVDDYSRLIKNSKESPDRLFAIFKHSTRCPISSVAKFSLQSRWDKHNPDVPIYLLNLIAFRDVSNLIASDLSVEHQSPQLILIKNAKQVYNASHSEINAKAVKAYK